MFNIGDQSAYRFNKEEHIHLFENKPLIGTSTALKVITKPLTYWAAGLAVKEFSGIEDCKVFTKIKNRKATKAEQENLVKTAEAWVEKNKNMTAEKLLDICQRAYTAHASTLKEKAEEGTDLHAIGEKWIKKCITEFNGTPIMPVAVTEGWEFLPIIKFIEWANENVKRFILSEAYVYSLKMWTGGIFDVLFEMNDGKLIIGDLKSSAEAYANQFLQPAGYDIQLAEQGAYDADGKCVYLLERPVDGYMIFPFGGKKFEPVARYDVNSLKEGFQSALNLHKLLNIENR